MPSLGIKQFQDDINSLKEFDEGDDFVCELKCRLRGRFFFLKKKMYVDDFCALCAENCCAFDLKVIRARYWGRGTTPPPRAAPGRRSGRPKGPQ